MTNRLIYMPLNNNPDTGFLPADRNFRDTVLAVLNFVEGGVSGFEGADLFLYVAQMEEQVEFMLRKLCGTKIWLRELIVFRDPKFSLYRGNIRADNLAGGDPDNVIQVWAVPEGLLVGREADRLQAKLMDRYPRSYVVEIPKGRGVSVAVA